MNMKKVFGLIIEVVKIKLNYSSKPLPFKSKNKIQFGF
jgi:hypothetical protein